MNITLLKYGGILALLVGAGVFIDQRARSQVHKDYELAQLQEVKKAYDKVQKDFDERAKIDVLNFELLQHYQRAADSARNSEYRMRKSLDEFGIACESSPSPGCKAARDIGELFRESVQRYRELGEEASRNYAKAKKCEAYYEIGSP